MNHILIVVIQLPQENTPLSKNEIKCDFKSINTYSQLILYQGMVKVINNRGNFLALTERVNHTDWLSISLLKWNFQDNWIHMLTLPYLNQATWNMQFIQLYTLIPIYIPTRDNSSSRSSARSMASVLSSESSKSCATSIILSTYAWTCTDSLSLSVCRSFWNVSLKKSFLMSQPYTIHSFWVAVALYFYVRWSIKYFRTNAVGTNACPCVHMLLIPAFIYCLIDDYKLLCKYTNCRKTQI